MPEAPRLRPVDWPAALAPERFEMERHCSMCAVEYSQLKVATHEVVTWLPCTECVEFFDGMGIPTIDKEHPVRDRLCYTHVMRVTQASELCPHKVAFVFIEPTALKVTR